jgi:hypothetical protein
MCLLVAVATAVAVWMVERGADPAPPPAAGVPTMPTAPRPVDVKLDTSRRPYDVSLRPGGTVTRRPLAVLHAPSRRIVFMGGEETMYVRAGEHPTVTLAERPGRRYRVDAIWVKEPYPKFVFSSPVAIVIVERDTPVVRWREEGYGYGTDAGLGAVTTAEWAARPKGDETAMSRAYWNELVEKKRLTVAADVDGHEGVDTVVFGNGFGDGGFPSLAGYDAAGHRAQIVLWTPIVPWRLAFPEGAPPTRVTQREKALAACLAGRRTIDGARCRVVH